MMAAVLQIAVSAAQDTQPEEEFIMVIDADSILRMPFYPEHFNVTRGAAPPLASCLYTSYLMVYRQISYCICSLGYCTGEVGACV